MENASKALIMAGTMLIGILLVALMVYFFSSAAGVRRAYSRQVNNTRMEEFNTDFTKYAITETQYEQSGKKTYVTMHDIITLANNADEFNKELNEGDFDYITIKANFKEVGTPVYNKITNGTTENKNEMLSNYMDKKFVIADNGIDYNETTGRIKEMRFNILKED